MKLYFLKKDALETLKSNLKANYTRYYTESSNKWIIDEVGEDAFVEFKEVGDFALADLTKGLSKGEIDLQNCKVIYSNLNFLTRSQASDERVWAGLCHSQEFYNYVRMKWDMTGNNIPAPDKAISRIESRFFFFGGIRSGCFRNTLSKCWWVGQATYDVREQTPFEKLNIIGSNDINSKITEIFRNYTFTSNPEILDGIINCFRHFKDEGSPIIVREELRPSLQKLNAIGGGVILDCLNSKEITDIMIDNIIGIRQNDDMDMKSDVTNIVDPDDEDEKKKPDENMVINPDEPEEESGIEEAEEGEGTAIYVSKDCTVYTVDSSGREGKYLIKEIAKTGKLPKVAEALLYKHINDVIVVDGNEFRITDIILPGGND